MAQIFVMGHVTEDLVIKNSQNHSDYVCFHLREYTGNGRIQIYQVWAWDRDVSRLVQFGVKKGSLIWLTGTLQLVDSTRGGGKEATKLLKVSLTNWAYLPTRQAAKNGAATAKDFGTAQTLPAPPCEALDGDSGPLPE